MRKPTRDESEDVHEGLTEIEEQKEAERIEDLRYQAELFDAEEEYENFSFYESQKDGDCDGDYCDDYDWSRKDRFNRFVDDFDGDYCEDNWY